MPRASVIVFSRRYAGPAFASLLLLAVACSRETPPAAPAAAGSTAGTVGSTAGTAGSTAGTVGSTAGTAGSTAIPSPTGASSGQATGTASPAGAATTATSGTGAASAWQPDCSRPDACLCPWKAEYPLSSWLELAPYPVEDRRCANHSRCEWQVGDRAGEVVARHVRPDFQEDPLPFKLEGTANDGLAGRRLVAQVQDGWIVAFNAGEWGAGLWWVGSQGKPLRKLSDAHSVALIPSGSKVIAAVGYDHMGINQGEVLEVGRAPDGTWQARQLARLGAAIYAAAPRGPDAILLVTLREVLSMDLTGKTTVLYRSEHDLVYPASIVVRPSGEIYVGMRHAVMKLVPQGTGYRERWLVQPQCRTIVLDVPGFDCRCTAPDR